MNAVVIVVDGLHVGHVGAYGNAWIETPALDRLAAEGFVFDQFLINSPHLKSLYRSYWRGLHPLDWQEPPEEGPSLPKLLASAGVTTALLSDEPEVVWHPAARAFDSVVPFELPDEAQVAEEIDQTHLAGAFARIVDWLESAPESFLLWCHLRGLGGLWDAPLEFRARYADEEDPDPPSSAEVPCRMLEEDYDPDHLLGISQAYAGQVSLLDLCLGAMLEFLQTGPLGENTLVVLLSARGFPLGEHRRVGVYDDALYGELVHVPLVLRFPDSLGEAARSQALVQPADLWATLLDWWRIADPPPSPVAKSLMPLVREENESLRDRLCLCNGGVGKAIRAPAWYLREGPEPELFVKPDDRWEVNNVSDRCRDVVERLQKGLADFEASLRSGRLAELPPLDEILLTGLE